MNNNNNNNNKSWQYMDKQQIMDLSKTQQPNNNNNNNNNDFINLMNNPNDEDYDDDKKKKKNNKDGDDDDDEIIVPSYDFQPIRSALPRHQPSLDVGPPPRVWNSLDSISISPLRNYSSVDSIEPAKGVPEKDHNAGNAALVSEIERTMKLFSDNLMHALEGVSARISQLESRSRNLENSVDDLKITMGNNQGSTDGKMRQLENILREVQSGVQVIRDKQDILEGQLHLAKLQTSKVEHQQEPQNHVQSGSYQPIASAPLQSHHQQPPPSLSLPPLSPPNAPPPAPQQSLPNQYPPPQRDSYYPPPSQQQETTAQQYPPTLSAPPPPLPQYPQPPPPQQYSQPPTPPHQHLSLSSMNPNQPQLPPSHHPEDSPYPPPHQSYPPNLQRQPLHAPNPSPQQFYPFPSNIYESPSTKLGSGYSSNEPPPYPYGGPPSPYSGGGMKQQHPQLPTARVLPQALPATSGTGNRVPIDDVVDKVSNMGFSREQARATVRKLMENGQAVDLNIVLDKLMNEGAEGQPPRGWYGR